MEKLKNVLSKHSYLLIYGGAHLIVDAICIGIVLSYYNNPLLAGKLFTVDMIVVYNFIAFGTQPLFGYWADEKNKSKAIGIIGMLMVLGAIFTMPMAYVSIVMVGLGNAMFHIGGGIASLYDSPNRATAPGLFVAPGAIGVFLGIYLSASSLLIYIFGILLLACIIGVMRNDYDHDISYVKEVPLIDHKGVLIAMSLLVVICVRSIIGGALYFPWNTTMTTKLLMLSMVVTGKALGGVLGDRLGFFKVGVVALLVAAPMLTLGGMVWPLGLIGIFAFNLTMPITLTALATFFRKYKGVAFGLTTFALIIGYMIDRVLARYYSSNQWVVLVISLIACLFLAVGLLGSPEKSVLEKELVES